ncbi:hypothetical protein [Planktotalea sp.]
MFCAFTAPMTKGATSETGLHELWQGNLWQKGVDAMKEAAMA